MRARCRIPCDFVVEGAAVVGEVRDVSAGGLGVLAEAPAIEQGEPVTLTLRAPGARPFAINALVWHVRAARRGADGKVIRSWGLVLGDASPDFAQLVETLTLGERPAAAARPQRAEPRPLPTPAEEAPPQPAPLPRVPTPETPEPSRSLQQFAIRIRQVGGSRTCRIVACGATEGEAAAAALSEIGAGWTLIDVRPLP